MRSRTGYEKFWYQWCHGEFNFQHFDFGISCAKVDVLYITHDSIRLKKPTIVMSLKMEKNTINSSQLSCEPLL